MIRSSFASFTTARLAIQANQNALAIIGQNMANVKTPGYTRQRLDQVSMNLRGVSNIYENIPDAHIGSGVLVTGVSQLRDPFLDTRYRLSMSNLGTEDKRLDVLGKLGDVFDETDRSGLDDQLGDLLKQLTTLSTDYKDSNDSLVRSSATTLTGILRRYSSSLDDVSTYVEDTTSKDVDGVNDLLKQIQQLNVSIRNSQVHGNPALELQDDRNQLIDQLSTYVDINVSHTTDVTMAGAKVDVLKIELVGSSALGNSPITLIDDAKSPAQFSFQKPGDGINMDYNISITDTLGTYHGQVTSNRGTFKSAMTMLNDSGEFDTPPNTNRGIGYYKGVLDNIAQTFASTFNKLNVDAGGGVLFAENDHSGTITAANITISDGWQNGTTKIVNGTDPDGGADQNPNVLNMVNALNKRMAFKSPGGANYFNGTIQECFTNMVNVQAMDYKSTNTTLENYLSIASDVAESKDSVSGVNIDEEAMDMMQYNNSLTAASRLMTTLDEALNTIINSMGVVGR